MARLISAKGLTNSQNIGSPQPGMKWIVKWALVVLHTSSNTGSRDATIGIIRGGNPQNDGTVLATTTAQTSTNAEYAGLGDVSNQNLYSPPTSTTQFYQFPEIFAADILVLVAQLQAGDTVDYYIMVEEEAS